MEWGKAWRNSSEPFVTGRIEQDELLDMGAGSLEEVAENLLEMDRINQWLGGERALMLHLAPRLLALRGRKVTVLDLGAGSAGIPRRLAEWGARRGLDLCVLAVDRSLRHLRIARDLTGSNSRAALLATDAMELSLAAGSVDYVISSMFMHHFCPAGLVRLLKDADRLARAGIIMSDLVRGRLPLMAFQLIAPVFARNRLTRHDGALSIRRAYTPHELEDAARAAGLLGSDRHMAEGGQIFSHFPWRMTLVIDK